MRRPPKRGPKADFYVSSAHILAQPLPTPREQQRALGQSIEARQALTNVQAGSPVVPRPRRHIRRVFLGFAALRLLQAIKHPRRQRPIYTFFMQPQLRLGGHTALIPRFW